MDTFFNDSFSALEFLRCGDTNVLKLVPTAIESKPEIEIFPAFPVQPEPDKIKVDRDQCAKQCPDEHDVNGINIRDMCQTPPEVISCDVCEWKAYKNYLLWGITSVYGPNEDETDTEETFWDTLDKAKIACFNLPEDECGGVLQMGDKYYVRKERNCFTANKERSSRMLP